MIYRFHQESVAARFERDATRRDETRRDGTGHVRSLSASRVETHSRCGRIRQRSDLKLLVGYYLMHYE